MPRRAPVRQRQPWKLSKAYRFRLPTVLVRLQPLSWLPAPASDFAAVRPRRRGIFLLLVTVSAPGDVEPKTALSPSPKKFRGFCDATPSASIRKSAFVPLPKISFASSADNKLPSAPARCVSAVTDVFDATVMDVSASVAGAAMSSGSAAPDKGSEPLSIEFKGLCGVPVSPTSGASEESRSEPRSLKA